MPDVSGPFDTAAYAQSSWYRDQGWWEPSAVQGAPNPGAGAGDLAWSSNGLTSSIALGRAHVRGAYYERTSTAYTYTHPANTNANPRIDTVVLRRDLAAKAVTLAVLQGTPAATPTAVALTQVDTGVWEFPLFDVTVPANSGTVLAAADRRVFLDPATGLLDTGWRSLTLNSPTVSGGGGSRYRTRGGVTEVRVESTYNGAYNTNFVLCTLPPGSRPFHPVYGTGVAYGGTPVSMLVNSNGDVATAAGFTATGVIFCATFESA